MSVAMVSEGPCPPHRHVAELSAKLVEMGNEITIYTRLDAPAPAHVIRADGGYDIVPVPAGPARRMAPDELLPHLGEFAQSLAAQWRLRPPDVVHAHRWTSGLAALIGARSRGVPVVHSSHEFDITSQEAGNRRRSDAERLIARNVSHLVVAGSADVSAWSRLGVPRTRISVVPGGVDLAHFHPEGPAAERGTCPRILVSAEPSHHRNLAAVVRAVSAPGGADLIALEDRTVPREELPALLRSADVVVCAPPPEQSGVVALQAMACGVPVVAVAAGVLNDLVVHDVTGLHVPPHNATALAKVLRSLLTDPTRREEFGVAARDRAIARHSWERVAKETLAVYRTAAARTGSQEVEHGTA